MGSNKGASCQNSRLTEKQDSFGADKRLVLAIEEMGVSYRPPLRRQGEMHDLPRNEFVSGEPERMTQAEYDLLKSKDLLGEVRLSCQLLCDEEMELRPVMTLESVEGWTDTGPEPTAAIEPTPEWHDKAALTES